MRRISTGIVGRELLGRFTAFDNSLRSIENNQDIVLNPNGSGIVRSDAHIQVNDENSVRFADSGSSNYVEIKAPASLGSNITLTLPDSTTAGNVLTTDGSGNLAFSDLTIEVSNQSADTDTYYPLLSTSNSGSISSVDTSSSKLSFQPSSGTLTVDILSSNNVDIGGGDIDGVTIGASSAPTVDDIDINGGSIDGATIGANNPAAGTFSALTETSSEIYKENIRPIDDAIQSVSKLQGVVYDRKDGTSKNEAGLIAEQVAKVLPDMVTYRDGEPDGVKYSKITAYIIESIKSLQNELSEIKRDG